MLSSPIIVCFSFLSILIPVLQRLRVRTFCYQSETRLEFDVGTARFQGTFLIAGKSAATYMLLGQEKDVGVGIVNSHNYQSCNQCCHGALDDSEAQGIRSLHSSERQTWRSHCLNIEHFPAIFRNCSPDGLRSKHVHYT